jgi:predicted PurR-regulated permease PerM
MWCFVFVWFEPNQHKKVNEVMKEIEVIIKSYLIGLLIQIAYITILYLFGSDESSSFIYFQF